MSQRCQLTGREPGFGKTVSHSHRRTSRRFDPNIQTKHYEFEGRRIRLRLCTDAIKTIDRIGIAAAVVRIRAQGGEV